ncbi:MAG: cell envelope-related transcriptional attenuator, partial [Actinobacteria bacterium]|nr:cell envelope-related transcriptional attenuator [Actinomycetota bacterium]
MRRLHRHRPYAGGMAHSPHPAPASPAVRRPSAFLAAVLSALLPGAGHLYLGRRRRGWALLGIMAVAAVPAVWWLATAYFGDGLLEAALALTPNRLILLVVADVALLGFRAFAAADAYLIASPGKPRSPAGLAAIGGLVLLLGVTAYPHLYVGERVLLAHDLLTHDFNQDPGQVALEDVTTTSSGATTSTGAGASSTTATVPPATTTTLSAAFPEEGRVNVLLLGGDSGVGRRGIRTDTMIVVSIDPETGWTAMFGIPRNLMSLPIPPGHPAQGAWPCGDCFGMIANELYGWGLQRPDLFGGPNSGANAMKDLIGYLLDIDIHYYALVDLEGFVEIIDAIGGVDIYVPERIYDTEYPNLDGTYSVIDLQPGTYDMDGEMALYFARSRQGSTDFNRMNRQRCVLEALAESADPVSLVHELPTIVPAVEQSVFTDLPMDELAAFINLLSKVNTTEIVSIRFMPYAPEFDGTPTSYIAEWTADRYPVPDRDFIAQTVATALSLPPLEAIEVLNLRPLDDI